jgi:general secretion pathway protein G
MSTKKEKSRNRRRDRGITLIELLVVIVILGIIATLVAQNTVGKIDDAKRGQAKNQIAEIEGALDLFRLDAGRYPTADEGLQALRIRPSAVQNWDGPYLRKDLVPDPWGKTYVYRQPGEHGDFDLISFGADGQEGGEGDAADIVNW